MIDSTQKHLKHFLLLATIAVSIVGCNSSGNVNTQGDKQFPIPLFAEGTWFKKTELESIKEGRLHNEFFWHFNDFRFVTQLSDQNKHQFHDLIGDASGEVIPCEEGWCFNDEMVARFEIIGDDTLAYFPRSYQDDGSPFARADPPNLETNNNPDWLWRKYYFARSYQCRYPRIDSGFSIRMDEDGRVHGSKKWVRYSFHTEHSQPLVWFYNKSDDFRIYRLATYPGSVHGFTLHDVLNEEMVNDGEGQEVETGDLHFEFVAE